ncbi:MAG: S1 RNA-binding domain-containing protein, partial [Deltaproteobacteria bacterium]
MTAPNEFEALLSEYGRRRDPRVGDRVSGTVVSIGAEHVFVDVGAKAEGVLDIDQVTDAEGRVAVAVGDPIEATVARRDDRTGQLMLRVRLTGGRQSYEDIEQAYADGLPVEGLVTGTNKGGVEVRIGAARAFCPISQLDLGFVEHAEDYVGQRLAFLIAKYEGGARPNIVLSRRALLEHEQRAQAEKTLETLEVGSVVSGTVTSVRDYGAFVDIGGIEGMVHVSELGFGHVAHPSEVLSVGQRVEVAVLRIEETGDPKRPRKIALSV